MLAKVADLVQELDASGTRYCHWKSNLPLAEAVSGETDIDLLVHREDASRFRAALSHLGFRPAASRNGDGFPSVEHHFALDAESGALVHVHAYYRVITGESLAKNYRFPIENMLLQNTRQMASIPVLTKSAELAVYTLRMMLKHTSLVELLLLVRDSDQARKEIQWLLEEGPIDETLRLVRSSLPVVDATLFSQCIEALRTWAPLHRRIGLALRLRRQLGPYARHSGIRARLIGMHKIVSMAFRRLTRAGGSMVPQSGGAVIAFVGSEATGKSTLLSEASHWLGEHLDVVRVHAGKPRSTALTAMPNLFLPALRSLLPAYRSTRVEADLAADGQAEAPTLGFPLLFGIRSVLLAYDRRALLKRAFRRSANGTIVLCDRYPSLRSGAPDSPQLRHFALPPGPSLRRRLSQIEARLYQEIPPPDLVIHLTAPLDVTVQRNATRGKREPDEFVRRRYFQSTSLDFGDAPVCRINTDRPFAETVRQVREAIWGCL